VSISFDSAAEVFDRTRGLPANVKNEILDILKEELEECGRILDVAVGTGKWAKPLQDAGFVVVGLDISRKMLAKACEKRTENLALGDACVLPFQSSAFDASISVSTLHLIKDYRLAMREIVRVTRKALFSILREGLNYGTTPGGVYRDLLEKYGHSCRYPGVGLWGLKEIIKPTKSRFATSYKASTKERIAFLSEKAFSYQWNVPDDLHEKAMEELGKMFVGKREYSCDFYVHKWDIRKIEDYLSRQNGEHGNSPNPKG
jgi:ubiquinone/menaquinone biosynthesis C-methylase UbiE